MCRAMRGYLKLNTKASTKGFQYSICQAEEQIFLKINFMLRMASFVLF